MRCLALTLAVLVVAACSHDHGPAKVKKAPQVDRAAALRGGGPARSPRIANYRIEAKLDTARHAITGSELLTWTNTGETPVDTLPFHLYMNAFKNDATLFARTSHGTMRRAHMSEVGWGWIQLESVQVGDTELVGKLRYPGAPGDPPDQRDETVVELPLPQPVAPGAQIEVRLRFSEQLPEVWARAGYKGDFHMVGQWFPKIGVRTGPAGGERWECQPYHAFGEFFADFGSYDVLLTVPSTHVVAATGVLKGVQDQGQMRTLTYHADDVHDFAWVADPFMEVKTGVAHVGDGDTVEVRVYARKEQAEFAQRHLDAAIGAVERFSADFVPYPWSILTVVDPPMDAQSGAGGMEYPTLVTTSGDSVFARPGIRIPELVTIHEVGHNWFQGMLASNEPEEPWLDEGVDDWADAHVMSELYGPRRGLDWQGWQGDLFALWRTIVDDPSSVPQPLATAAYAFVDESAWKTHVYTTTERTLTTIEHVVGTGKFMAAMKAYARAWAFKHPTGKDLVATLAKETGEDLAWYFDSALAKVGGLRLAIRSAGCRPAHALRGVIGDGAAKKTRTETESPDVGAWRCEVVVDSIGAVHVPVDVELRFADGTAERRTWDDRDGATWFRFVIDRSSPIVEVRLDPDGKIALDSPVRHALRVEGNGSASLRAAARAASWAQTLMQLVGP